MKEIKRKNYSFMPDAEKIIEKYKEQKEGIEKAEKKLQRRRPS